MISHIPEERKIVQLHLPLGQTLIWGLLLLALFLGSCEILARSSLAEWLPPRDWGTTPAFGIKMNRLEAQLDAGEEIDCFLIGSSMVHNGMNPDLLNTTYYQQTGETIHCFNFSIPGMTASGVGKIAEVLTIRYHPKLIIYGTSARDFVPHYGDAINENSAWMNYHLGQVTFEGWLIEYSHAYQRYLFYESWLTLKPEVAITAKKNLDQNVSPLGYMPKHTVSDVFSSPPDRDGYRNSIVFDLLANYQVHPDDVEGLETLFALKEKGVEIVLVEMPVPDNHFYFYTNGKADYRLFIDVVAEAAQVADVPFYQPNGMTLIPEDGWADYIHLNRTGAEVFSEWLACQLAAEVSDASKPCH